MVADTTIKKDKEIKIMIEKDKMKKYSDEASIK